jgi:hypothetical protein
MDRVKIPRKFAATCYTAVESSGQVVMWRDDVTYKEDGRQNIIIFDYTKAGIILPLVFEFSSIFLIKWGDWGLLSGLHGRRKIVFRSPPSTGHFWN